MIIPFDGSYEPETQRIFRKVLKEGDQCVVAGAHRGFFASLAASMVGPSGQVYAFEPELNNFMELVTNTGEFGNVQRFNFALCDRDRMAPFFINKDNDGGHALFDVRCFKNNVLTMADPQTYEVQVKRLDDVLGDEDMSRLKLCLFDVEGAEHSVLKGAINTITDNNVPYIICEINNPALEKCHTSQKELRSYMAMYGYKTYLIEPHKTTEIAAGSDVMARVDEHTETVFNVLFSRRGPV